MSVNIRLSSLFSLFTAGAVASCVLLSLTATAQSVGPMPPQPKPQKESAVGKALGKLFKKDGDPDAQDDDDEVGPKNTPASTIGAPAAATTAPQRPPMLNQPPLTQANVEKPQVDAENPPVINHPRLDDPNNPLGLTETENKLKRLIALLDANRYAEAKPGLIQLRQWLVDVTEAHIALYKTLNQIPSARAQAELEKELALLFAQLRDRTMMEVARVYIAEQDYHRAIKELTEVVKSQPRSRLGLRSYEMLQEIGFTEKLQLAQ